MSVRTLWILAATLAVGTVQAQKVAPGLWEHQTEMKLGNPEMQAQLKRAQEQMAKMPPEQRKMMEDMMAKQGMQMAGGGASPTIRHCVSKEQAERADVPQDPDGRCKRDSMDRSGSTMRFKFTCTNPPSTGTGEITFSGDKSYTMKMLIESGAGKGQPGSMELNTRAKWLSADCGNLKPRP